MLALALFAATVPAPTQLAWQDFEIGALVQYNIGLYGEKSNNYACQHGILPATAFAPKEPIDTDGWITAAKGFGARYAVLTTQAGCGFHLWPTNSTIADGRVYPYALGHDLAKRFVESCRRHGLRPGIYSQIANSVYCSVVGCFVQPVGGAGACGNQTQYEEMCAGAHSAEAM
jgi:alpha-L-fucosidase